VGLLEASFPSKADNVLPDDCFFTMYVAGGILRSEIAIGILHEAGSNHRRYAPRTTQDFSITSKSTVVRNISLRATQDEIRDENHKLARRESALQTWHAYSDFNLTRITPADRKIWQNYR